jgi:hypothetical protein
VKKARSSRTTGRPSLRRSALRQFADQGSKAANEVEAQRELRRTFEEVLEPLGPS